MLGHLDLKDLSWEKKGEKKEKEKGQKKNYCVENIRKLKSNIFHPLKVV